VQPFSGLRVVDLSRSQAGAHVSQLFADFGAEVVMVEPPGGSTLREMAAFAFWARGKKSVVLDVHAPDDRQAILDLARGADVVIESFRPGVMEALGLGYEALSAGNPGLVYASISGFGDQGPLADAPGYEHLVYAKLGVFEAFRRMSPTPDRPPFVTVNFATFCAAQCLLHGVLAALHEREKSGLGQHVETSLARAFLTLDTWAWVEHVLARRFPDALKMAPAFDELGRPQHHVLFRIFVAQTSDGEWLQFAATAERLFKAMMRALGLSWMYDDPEWAKVPMFEDPAKFMDLWTRMLTAARAKSYADWNAIFDKDRDVFAERFRTGPQVLDHPQLLHDGLSIVLEDAEHGPVRQSGPLVRALGTPATLRSAPRLDEHRETLLSQGWSSPRLPLPAPAGAAPRGLPLEGVTIVEFAVQFAAPHGPALLTELGARVIKVEPLEGDPVRTMVSLPEAGGVRAMMGKESICLDLSQPEGRELAREICARADVVVQGYRAGAVQRLGIDYETIRQLNPDVIYLNASGYGVDGPYGVRPAYAPSIASAAGIPMINLGAGETGDGDMPISEVKYLARRLGGAGTHNTANADGVAAVAVGTAILFGLYARDRGAGGQELCTSMVNSTAHMNAAYTVQRPGCPPPPSVDGGLNGFTALYRIYDAAEGVVFLAAPSDREFARLADALGRPELAADPRFATRKARQGNDAPLVDVLSDIFASRTAAEWEQALLSEGVGLVEVAQMTPEAVMIDTPLGREMDLITDVVDPTWDETTRQGVHVLLSRSATQAKPAVLAGQHTDEILRELGRGDEIARLRAEKLVG